ncbi:MAG: polysaccharide pyruvyl transferase family protein [Faecousia sp.]
MSEAIRKIVYPIVGQGVRQANKCSFFLQRDCGRVIVFNTAEYTANLGDYIIMRYCNQVLRELFGERDFVDVSTHAVPSDEAAKVVKKTKFKFVSGTNLLTSHIEQWWNWRLPDGFRKKLNYRNAILLGVGWGAYQDECSDYSRLIYHSILNPSVLHSVRDQYTEDKLKAAGIKNVINTGCPTMWNLTPDFCKKIPNKKSNDVITTITDYRRDVESDNLMLNILGRNYKRVYLWLQGCEDEEYLKQLNIPSNLVIIPRNLSAYEEFLSQGDVDYVGTRLHAGIFALNHRVRSLIVAVDNRAIEISKDTNLPIIRRDRIRNDLESFIYSSEQINIQINLENIEKFKAQFRR